MLLPFTRRRATRDCSPLKKWSASFAPDQPAVRPDDLVMLQRVLDGLQVLVLRDPGSLVAVVAVIEELRCTL